MADKNNANSFFLNDESNPEDFYLNNHDNRNSRKSGNSDTEKQDTQDQTFFAPPTPPVVDSDVIDAINFDWDDAELLAADSDKPSLDGLDFTHEDDVLSNRDRLHDGDEEAINEILKTEVVNYDTVGGNYDYFADLNVQPTHNYKEQTQEQKFIDPFATPTSEPKQESNLTELDTLKQKLDNASESFSQITNSIEVLSGDIDNANKDFSDYVDKVDEPKQEEKVQPEVSETELSLKPQDSVDQFVEELEQLSTPVHEDQPTSPAVEAGVDAEETQAPIVNEVEPISSSVEDSVASESIPSPVVDTELEEKVTEVEPQPILSPVTDTELEAKKAEVESQPIPSPVVDTELEEKVTEVEPQPILSPVTDTELEAKKAEVEFQPIPSPEPVAHPQPDYAAVLADLKQQALMQVQNAVQSEMDRLISAKAKLEAELAALTRDRNFENNLTNLNEEFSSIVSSRQETTSVPTKPVSEPNLPTDNIEDIEAQRTSIINATKKIMETYDALEQSLCEPKLTEEINHNQARLDELASEVGNIRKELAAVIKSEVANAIKEEIADIKSSMHPNNVTQNLDQQKATVNESKPAMVGDEEKSTDSLGEMRNSLRHRQVGNEVEEQSRLYDIERIRHELKDEILNEVRAWNSNLIANTDHKFQQPHPAEEILGSWFNENEAPVVKENHGFAPRHASSARSANLIFNQDVSNLKGRDLILKYVKDLTKKKHHKPKQ